MVLITGTLILNGNLTSNGDITITPTGLVIPVPDQDTKKAFYSYETDYMYANGLGRFMTSTTGSITHQGFIDGRGQGFSSNQGPGASSRLLDNLNIKLEGYGATHAGLGALLNPTNTVPSPEEPYGFRESPVSLGSGGGYFHNPSDIFGEDTVGGGAIKLIAPSGPIQIDGVITMAGQDGKHAGGAAGGSIWLVGWSITGSGSMSVAGGATLLSSNAGGGGGGYISLWYERTNTFSGDIFINGQSGGGDGKSFIKQIESFLEEPFSGSILNTKWWDSTGKVTVYNGLQLNSPQDDFSVPAMTSIFGISGKNIIVDMDYNAIGPEPDDPYNVRFLLWADSNNWVGLARKKLGLYGVSSSNGFVSASGIPFPYQNITFRLMKNDSTFSFQYYDSTSNPLTIYTDVLSGLANKDFKVMMETDKLCSATTLVDQLRLTPLDIANNYVQLDGTPADLTSVALNVLYGTSQYYGYDFYVTGNQLHWDTTTSSTLKTLVDVGDVFRMAFGWNPPALNALQAGFNNLRVYQGVLDNHATQDSVLYVDPDFGSDSSNGRQLNPLKNLFVATAWSQPGGVVVLYDGTYNPTRVKMKDITIRGAEGARPYITSQNVQDTTGSNWEDNALSFYKSEGLVYNVQTGNSTIGIRVENSPDFEITKSVAFNTSIGFDFINSDPVVRRSLLHNNDISVDFTGCNNIDVNSNIVYDSRMVGINNVQCQNVKVVGNTIDNYNEPPCTAIFFNSSSGVVSSNCITYGNMGLQMSLDSSVASFSNNYVFLTNTYSTRPPDSSANDISVDPIYIDSFNHDYHVALGSPNIGTGLGAYDDYFIDYDGAPRIDNTVTMGALEYISGIYTGDFYVEGSGDDYRNFGGKEDPFRTLDKALLIADATTHIDRGHYDTYYLQLHNQYIDLDQLFIYTPKINHLVSYKTLLPDNIKEGYYYLPGFLTNPGDSSSVALNVVGGSTQIYGYDYRVEAGALVWKGMNLESFLATGDTLRIIYGGQLQYKALNALTLHSHYSNLEIERAIFVSPGGSDSTVLGGDGTNTGGIGSFNLPYRTIDKALSISVPGDSIVAIAGEYPIFRPLNDRVLVTATDQTVVTNGQQFLEDDFSPNDFRIFGTSLTGPIPWNFTYSGGSYAVSGGGFLSLTYDGINTARADSIFQITNDFDVQADLRAFVDPLKLMITSPDNTMYVNYSDQTYTCGAVTGGKDYYCYSAVDSVSPGTTFITDYVSVTYENISNQYVPLAFLPEDCSNIAVNIVGGTAQNIGDDFTLNDGNITWDSSSSLAELDPGEILRIIYKVNNNTLAPIRVDMSLKGNRFTTRVFNNGVWETAFRRDMVGNYIGPWSVSFVMDSTGANRLNCLDGRGFASGFLAVADSIVGSDAVRPYGTITERKNLVLFPDKPLGIITDSTLHTGYDGTRYRARIDATGGTSDWAWPYSWSWQVDSTVPGVTFFDKQSYAWLDGTPAAAGDYTFTVQLNDPGSRDQSVSKDFFLTII